MGPTLAQYTTTLDHACLPIGILGPRCAPFNGSILGKCTCIGFTRHIFIPSSWTKVGPSDIQTNHSKTCVFLAIRIVIKHIMSLFAFCRSASTMKDSETSLRGDKNICISHGFPGEMEFSPTSLPYPA